MRSARLGQEEASLVRLRRGRSRRRCRSPRQPSGMRTDGGVAKRRGQSRPSARPHDERPSGHLGERRRRRLGRRRLRHDRALRRARVEVLRERRQREPHRRLGHRRERRLGLGIRGKRPPLGRHGLEGRLAGRSTRRCSISGPRPRPSVWVVGADFGVSPVVGGSGFVQALDRHGLVRLRRARRRYALEGLGLRPGHHLARRNLREHAPASSTGEPARTSIRSTTRATRSRESGGAAPATYGLRRRAGPCSTGTDPGGHPRRRSPQGRDGTASAAAGPTTSGPSATTE